jgi:hypothetical protein
VIMIYRQVKDRQGIEGWMSRLCPFHRAVVCQEGEPISRWGDCNHTESRYRERKRSLASCRLARSAMSRVCWSASESNSFASSSSPSSLCVFVRSGGPALVAVLLLLVVVTEEELAEPEELAEWGL